MSTTAIDGSGDIRRRWEPAVGGGRVAARAAGPGACTAWRSIPDGVRFGSLPLEWRAAHRGVGEGGGAGPVMMMHGDGDSYGERRA